MPPSTMRWDSLAMNLQGTLMFPARLTTRGRVEYGTE